MKTKILSAMLETAKVKKCNKSTIIASIMLELNGDCLKRDYMKWDRVPLKDNTK